MKLIIVVGNVILLSLSAFLCFTLALFFNLFLTDIITRDFSQ